MLGAWEVRWWQDNCAREYPVIRESVAEGDEITPTQARRQAVELLLAADWAEANAAGRVNLRKRGPLASWLDNLVARRLVTMTQQRYLADTILRQPLRAVVIEGLPDTDVTVYEDNVIYEVKHPLGCSDSHFCNHPKDP